MSDEQSLGIIVGVFKRDNKQHYRRELARGGPSVAALCGAKGDWLGDPKNNDETERRMDMPVCSECEAATSL